MKSIMHAGDFAGISIEDPFLSLLNQRFNTIEGFSRRASEIVTLTIDDAIRTLLAKLIRLIGKKAMAINKSLRIARCEAGTVLDHLLHDARNMITIVKGNAILARMNMMKKNYCEIRENLGLTQRAAVRALEAIRETHRKTTGVINPEKDLPTSKDLRVIIDQALEMSQPKRDKVPGSVSVYINTPTTAVKIKGSEGELRRVLTNIFGNGFDAISAKKYPSQSRQLTILAGIRGKELVMEISDNGVGMTPEVLARIFESNFSTKGSDGQGAGLHFCWNAIFEMQGQISAKSEYGMGTTFNLVIPLA